MRVELQDPDTIIIRSRPQRMLRVVPHMLIGVLTAIVCIGYGAWGITSETGAADGSVRQMTPGSPEAIFMAWLFLLMGSIGGAAAVYWFVWNTLATERLSREEGRLVLQRAALGYQPECSYRLEQLDRIECRNYQDAGSPQIAVNWSDISRTSPSSTVVILHLTNGAAQACGLDLSSEEAATVVNWLRRYRK